MRRLGMKRLLGLFFPILLITFTNTIFLLIEKLFLAQVSSQAMQAAVNVAYVSGISQAACVLLAMMAQVAVGKRYGEGAYLEIGPSIWQFIWFSLFSSLITVPINLWFGDVYFQDTEIGHLALPYFHTMTRFNFLYPLGAALACFFLGQGKTRLLLFTSIGSLALKIGVSYLLIFGKGGFPALGILGGAWGSLITQGSYCLFLFSIFMNGKNRFRFATSQWKFRWKLFKESVYPGLLRALNRVITLSCWAITVRLVIAEGEDYALALSLGGSFFFFLPCFGDALCQAQVTIVSQSIGAGRPAELQSAARMGYFVAVLIGLLGAVPFLLFPEYIFKSLFPTLSVSPQFIRELLLGIFCSFSLMMISFIPISYILAFRDMNFTLFTGLFSWVNGYLLTLFFLKVISISGSQFWIISSITHASVALMCQLRANYLIRRLEKSLPSPWLKAV